MFILENYNIYKTSLTTLTTWSEKDESDGVFQYIFRKKKTLHVSNMMVNWDCLQFLDVSTLSPAPPLYIRHPSEF